MAIMDIDAYVKLVPALNQLPGGTLWTTYDTEADTLYVNFRKPSVATDSEFTDEDVILRYVGDELVGLTILHASRRDSGGAGA